jgi:hypothetical protein
MSADIAPDIVCPHCGPCIVCPHTMFYATPTLTYSASDRSFRQRIEDRRRREAAAAGGPVEPAATTPRPRPADIAQPGKNPAYVAAAIRDELDELARARKGTRNTVLHEVACNIFELVKGGHADKQACWDELKRIGSAIGLTDSEMVGFDGGHGTLGSAWEKVGPRDVPAPGMAARVVEVEAAELLPRRGAG